MATRRWIGAKQPVSKKEKLVAVSGPAGTVYSLTSNESTASYTRVTGDTEATIVAALIAAATAIGREFSIINFELDATDDDTFYAVSANLGHDFSLTSNANITQSSVDTATGPNHWDADNFEGGVAPVNGDTVVFEANSVDLLFNLDQGTLTGMTLEFRASYTGRVGLPNVNGQGGFPEYRDQFLKIEASTVKVGQGVGNGSSRIKLDLDAVANSNVEVLKTGTSTVNGQKALQIRNGTLIDLSVAAGEVQVKPFSTDPTTTIDDLDVSGGTVVCQPDVTIDTVTQSGGVIESEANNNGGSIYGGAFRMYSAAAVTGTLILDGGTLESYSTGDITALTVKGNSLADFSFIAEAGTTITTLSLESGELRDPHNRVGVTTLQDYKTLRAS